MDVVEHMKSLIAVADAGSFTQAGRTLGRSKALISKHVGDLEDRLGARLLNRTTRKVSLTDLGRAYVERARALIADLESLEIAVQDRARSPRGKLRMTAPQAFGELSLMELVCAFQNAYPDIEPDIFLSDRIVDLVGEGFDLAIRVTAMPDSTFIVRRLCEVPVRVVASPAYIDALGRPEMVEDLRLHRGIADTNLAGGGDVWRFKAQGEGASVSIRVPTVLRVNSAIAARQAAVAGRGISLCPDFAVASDLAAGTLVDLFPGQPDYDLALHILYPNRQHLSARVRAFIDFAADWYAQGPRWSAVNQP
jgi:DNA-binding transcriptional LysR family regulator